MKKGILFLLFWPVFLQAQTDTSALAFSLGGYAEMYYGFDFNRPAGGDRPDFVYAHNRHNEFNANIALLQASVQGRRVRGNMALMAGTYANANLAAEPGTLQNVFEANAGYRLSKNADLWIDAGIFGSHIGFESAIGKDCWTLTRSILADNSPYYEAGAKLTYTTADGKWLFSALALNGWQRIRRVPGNSLLSGGWQVTWMPSDRVTLNSSSFVGTDYPDENRRIRLFHNFYGIFQVSERLGLIAGLDVGREDDPAPRADARVWYAPVAICRYQMNDRLTVAGRMEYYSDKEGVIVATQTDNGFQTFGASLNFDVQLHQNALWRIEGKFFNSQDAVFEKDGGVAVRTNSVLTTALAFWF